MRTRRAAVLRVNAVAAAISVIGAIAITITAPPSAQSSFRPVPQATSTPTATPPIIVNPGPVTPPGTLPPLPPPGTLPPVPSTPHPAPPPSQNGNSQGGNHSSQGQNGNSQGR
jgi:hypothetical protein